MKKILILLSFVIISVFAENQITKPNQGKDNSQVLQKGGADEALYKEIEGILSKFDTNNNIMQKNIEEIKKYKKANNDVKKENEQIIDEVNTKCKALKILNGSIATDICKRIEEHFARLEEERRFFIKFNDAEILKKYPMIIEDLYAKSEHIEFQIKEEDSRLYAKRKSYAIPLEEFNRVEDGMFVMIRLHNSKFSVTAYKNNIEEKWKLVK